MPSLLRKSEHVILQYNFPWTRMRLRGNDGSGIIGMFSLAKIGLSKLLKIIKVVAILPTLTEVAFTGGETWSNMP
jgi:hypothetical protein